MLPVRVGAISVKQSGDETLPSQQVSPDARERAIPREGEREGERVGLKKREKVRDGKREGYKER
jgi:hypothetical protein